MGHPVARRAEEDDGHSVLVDLQVRPGKREEFLAAMTATAEAAVREEPGCHRFDVCDVAGDPTRFVLYELYDDEAAFRAHQASRRTAELRAATLVTMVPAPAGAAGTAGTSATTGS